MIKSAPSSANKGMVLRVSLVVVMIVLICCFAAYLVFANAEPQTGENAKILDQAGIVLAVLLGIAAILLLIVNGWTKKPVVEDTLFLRNEINQWKDEIRMVVETLQGMQKEDIEDCYYKIGIMSEKLADLADELEGTIKQLPA